MSTNVLQTYYSGVLKRLKSEVDLLNKIIPHNTTKGTQNENAIKNVIKNFIPKRFAVGSGIVIDSFGNRSKQIDLLIYDAQLYPSLFSQSSTTMYPVETVLATIEIKTWLDNKALLTTFENTKSIRTLKHYVNCVTSNQPDPNHPIKNVQYQTKPPVSFLFAFHSDSHSPSTWKERFVKNEQFEDIPEASILLDIASVFRFRDIATRDLASFEAMYYQLRDNDINEAGDSNQVIFTEDANQTVLMNDEIYKSTNYSKDDKYPIFMPERAFLSFLLALNKLIEMQPRHISFDATKYLDEEFGYGQIC